MTRGTLLGGSTAILLAASAAPAGAATVATDAPCYVERGPITVAGQGFAPGAPVNVESTGIFGSVPVDAAGNFSLQTAAPTLPTVKPAVRPITLTASDGTNMAQVAVRVTNFRVATRPAAPSKPNTTVKWRVTGFRPGAKVYAHYVHRGKQRRRISFGRMPRRTCGTLTRTLRMIPISNPSNGKWRIQLDTRKRYRATTKPKLVRTGTVFTRVGR